MKSQVGIKKSMDLGEVVLVVTDVLREIRRSFSGQDIEIWADLTQRGLLHHGISSLINRIASHLRTPLLLYNPISSLITSSLRF